ncbi:MAG TPA: HAD-IB family hydrolase [Candidatus Moranbacteria bacterium]|nr:HAD-IB family hydrolase [Candidatus Moranbacteria bacterium]
MQKTKNKLAVFDIDGTIFRKNLHFELLEELSYVGIFPKKVRQELIKWYRFWLDNEGTYEDYRDRLVDLYEENIKGCKESDVMVAAKKVADFNAKRLYNYTRNMIGELSKTHVMIVISGSPIEIVKKYAELFNFDAFYGTVYEVDRDGVYTGRELFCPVHDKGLVVKQFMVEQNLTLHDSIGIGDTESDRKFLQLMDEPIAFNPDSKLKKIAEKNNWKIVVEKKDVIYEFCK